LHWWVLALAGCGRIHFDPLGGTSDSLAFEIGCADGEREGLAGEPTIAACSATWAGGLDLRAPRTGAACGDDRGPCSRGADACAIGWHLCGDTGLLDELQVIDASACANAGNGAWVGASSHCGTNVDNMQMCPYLTPPAVYGCYANNFCAEPICCGSACGGDQLCKDAVFTGATLIAGDVSFGCGGVIMNATIPISGFLCCRD